MKYPSPDQLISSYQTTYRIILMQTEGLDHEDSVLQPPNRGNCMNWVLGHILVGRNTALKLLASEPVWDDSVDHLYKTGADPITLAEQARPFDVLIAELTESQQRIEAALTQTSIQTLSQDGITDRGIKLVGEHLAGLHWHETYHTGQFELLRQLAGRTESIL